MVAKTPRGGQHTGEEVEEVVEEMWEEEEVEEVEVKKEEEDNRVEEVWEGHRNNTGSNQGLNPCFHCSLLHR